MKKYRKNIIILIIAIIIILYIALKDDFANIVSKLLNANMWLILLAIITVFFHLLLRSIVFLKITRNFVPNYSLKEAFHVFLMAQFLNGVTPFASGGQPGTIYLMNKRGIKIRQSTNILLQDSIIYQLAYLIIMIIAVSLNLYFNIFPNLKAIGNLVFVGFLLTLLSVSFLFFVSFSNKKIKTTVVNGIINFLGKIRIIKNKDSLKTKFINYIDDFNSGTRFLLQNKKDFVLKIFITVCSLILRFIIPYILLTAIMGPNNINFIYTVVGIIYVSVVAAYTPVPGGTGGLEYTFIIFFSQFASGSILTATMLLWRFVTFYIGMLLGAIALILYNPEKYEKHT